MGYVQAAVNAALDGANTAISHVQLHTGDPGATGTDNVAVNVAGRVAITLPAAVNGESSDEVTFDITDGGETYTNITLWDAVTGGNLQADGTLTPQESFAGPGTLDVTVNTSASST